MDNIYSYIGNLCLVIYIIALLFDLIKIKETNKILQTVLGLVLILNIFYPLNKIDTQSVFNSLEFYSITVNEEENTELIIENAKLLIENDIKKTLEEKNISYNDVSLHIHKENGSFLIKEINIYGSDEERKEEILKLLSDIVNEDVIFFRGEYG